MTYPAPGGARARRRQALRRTRPAVTTIVLDMGGVVIPTLFERVRFPSFPSGPFSDAARPDADYAKVEKGEMQERDYWARLAARHPELDIGALWRDCSVVREEVTGLLRRIGGRMRVTAFTNDMSHWFGPDWPARFPVLREFDTILEASVLGVLKPDPAAFRAAAQALGEEPRRCLFVDDLAANLDGAAAIGMRTQLFDVRDAPGSMARIAASLGLPPATAARRVFAVPRGPEVIGR
ncbi:HAD-IA family hydrolase [Pseudonocardia sp.]|uniref:HAD-IA family hydrolase n=1 Tax=Pseudonocardia sp. TaxID=60912 RepID=UPI003D148443